MSDRTCFCVDAGDLIVPFGGATCTIGPEPQRLGVQHNLVAAAGV